MNPQKQQIAIAVYCGCVCPICGTREPPSYSPDDKFYSYCSAPHPDYLNDLNACHEMEKALSLDQKIQYDKHLAEHPDVGFTWGATAAQRAEAFLRTIGKWEDDSFPTIPATGKPITQQEMEDKE